MIVYLKLKRAQQVIGAKSWWDSVASTIDPIVKDLEREFAGVKEASRKVKE